MNASLQNHELFSQPSASHGVSLHTLREHNSNSFISVPKWKLNNERSSNSVLGPIVSGILITHRDERWWAVNNNNKSRRAAKKISPKATQRQRNARWRDTDRSFVRIVLIVLSVCCDLSRGYLRRNLYTTAIHSYPVSTGVPLRTPRFSSLSHGPSIPHAQKPIYAHPLVLAPPDPHYPPVGDASSDIAI